MIDAGVIEADVSVVFDRDARSGPRALRRPTGPRWWATSTVWWSGATPSGSAPRRRPTAARSMRRWPTPRHLLREAVGHRPRRRPQSLVDGGRRRRACRRSQDWCCAPPRSSAPCASSWLGHAGTADGGHRPGRPVLPDSGDLRLSWRADVDPGGRRVPDRALHPRRGHPALLPGGGGRDQRAHGELLRPRGHRGPGRRLPVLRLGCRGAPDERVAQHPEPRLDPADRALLRGRHGVAGRRVPGAAAHPDERRHPKSARAPAGLGRGPAAGSGRGRPGGAPTPRPTGRSSTPWSPDALPSRALDDALVAHRLVDAAYRSAAPAGCPSGSGDGPWRLAHRHGPFGGEIGASQRTYSW
jgi:hypothetical protein